MAQVAKVCVAEGRHFASVVYVNRVMNRVLIKMK